jgi:hypothetical protein
MDVRHREDRLINHLNNIAMLTHGSDSQKKVQKEIDGITAVLVQERIVTKRHRIKDHFPLRPMTIVHILFIWSKIFFYSMWLKVKIIMCQLKSFFKWG